MDKEAFKKIIAEIEEIDEEDEEEKEREYEKKKVAEIKYKIPKYDNIVGMYYMEEASRENILAGYMDGYKRFISGDIVLSLNKISGKEYNGVYYTIDINQLGLTRPGKFQTKIMKKLDLWSKEYKVLFNMLKQYNIDNIYKSSNVSSSKYSNYINGYSINYYNEKDIIDIMLCIYNYKENLIFY